MRLPVAQPCVISYLHHANYLAVAETDPRCRDHLVNYFYQLHTRHNNAPGVGPEQLVDFHSPDGMYPRYPFVSNAYLGAPLLQRLGGGIVEQACAILDNGAYIEATLDEFFLREKNAYQSQYYPHPNLLFGYSAESRVFHALGFNRAMAYTEYAIGYDEMRQAWNQRMGLSILSLAPTGDYLNTQPFNPALVRTCLQDFLAARNSFLSYDPPGSVFGRATYAEAVAMVERKNGAAIDIRPWCVFHEHKRRLLALHEFLCDGRERQPAAGTAALLLQLVGHFHQLRNHLLEACWSGAQVKRAALEKNVGRIEAIEEEAIGALIAALD
ncbi:hypothetical protein ACFOLJ_22580 [Rugamonas sp. CCM 8940]|uniref:hypothetical protein n=1 Tax=Rugamonas sp. CCM 8940 TaxID=2765359 RepID=UPI0018F68D3A|nr:hypothetical protein [Rugamonas sp. CCM 8940]MBJ7312564.1 hypothetical protein [Rugamonas sp. CCM 8940]